MTALAVAPVCLSQPYDDWTAEFASEAWSAVADSSAELTSFYITLSDSDDSTCAHPRTIFLSQQKARSVGAFKVDPALPKAGSGVP